MQGGISMARTHRILTSLGFSALSVFLFTGCVSQEKYNAQKMRSDQLNEQLGAAQAQVNSATAENQVFKTQMERIRNSGDNQAALLVNQAATIADQSRQIDDLNARYNQAMQAVGKAGSGALPVQLTNELTTFASQNPDLVDFDAARGIVKFKSDVTFDPGSAVVKDTARTAIDRLAAILNGATASQYDLMVVGHTDSQPVSNPATIKAGHLDNWYLSAHRAIAVSKELQKVAVRSGRIQVAGYADQRPLDPTPTKEAMARNRRVEVLILPTTSHSTPAAAPAASPIATPKPAGPRTPMNKDVTADVPPRPIINK
jgi:chemotaxis protein MotB